MPEILPMMSVDSARLSAETMRWLTDGGDSPGGRPAMASMEMRRAVFVYAHDDNASEPSADHAPYGEYPADLWGLFVEARDAGCDWIIVSIDEETATLRREGPPAGASTGPMDGPELPETPRRDPAVVDEDAGSAEGEIPDGIEI